LNVAPKFTKEYWKNVFNRIKEAAASKMDEVKNTFSTKWNNIKNWFSTSIAPKFTKDYWVNKFSGIKDGAKNAFNGVIDAVERAINSIVNRINGLSWEVPSWVPAIGGQRWGFNFGQVHIPRLAEGGITNGSTIANIGEGGYREAVLPLERNTEWMDTLADKIAARQTATPTILNIDGKTFAQTSIDAINNLTKQTGSLKLILA
jgi:phage-related protein